MSLKEAHRNFGEDLFFGYHIKTAVYKTGNASYFSWPRAYVRLSAPLIRDGNKGKVTITAGQILR